MDTRRAIAVLLVAVVVIGAAPALASLATHSVPIQDEVPVTTDQTPTITLAADTTADVNMQDMWSGDELDIRTEHGNITVRGDPGASARLDVTDIEGAQTQLTQIDAGTNWLELNPADKNRLDVRGDVDTLAFGDLQANDGSTDIQLGGSAGGTAELRVYDLAANEEYGLYDASRDEVLGTFTTDSAGTATTSVDMPDGTHALQVRTAGDFDAPVLSNPDPEGKVTSPPDTLSVDVDAEAWPVVVEFTLEGETVATETVTEPTTVSADVTIDELGVFEWGVSAEDELGQTDTVATSFETPQNLTIREEHDPQSIVDNSTVTLRFFTVGGDIAVERTTEDGTLDMSGLPDSAFVLFVESDNHYDRRAYLDTIYDQEDVFVLNESEFPRGENEAIRSRFIYEDLTGNFPTAETTIQIERAMDMNGDGESEFLVVAGDYWGASNEFETVLEYGERYRLILVNQQTGEEHVAGTHIPTEDLSQTIRVSGLIEEAANESGVVGLAELNEAGDGIDIAYRDPADSTEELRIIVESRGGGGEVIYDETIAGPLGIYADTVALNETQAESDWVVRFESDQHRSAIPVGSGTVGLPVDVPDWLLTLLLSMAVTFVGALYGPRTAVLGAWAMVFVAAGAAMFGWAFSGASVVVAALVAVGATLMSRALP